MKLVLGFSGPAEHGKTTCANIARDWLIARNYNVLMVSFADKLKDVCKIMFRLSDKDVNNTISKSEIRLHIGTTPRDILQKFGTEVCRNTIPTYFPDITPYSIWTWNVEQDIKDATADTVIIIPDIRFDDELTMLNELKDCKAVIIHVVRPTHQSSVDKTHQSEQGLATAADYDIINSGTLTDLESIVSSLIESLAEYLG